MATKKLIEVALPLEKINSESGREKSIRFGHPSTLHLWWARRPLAAARAVIWSSLVDDPSAHPDLFPTEEEQSRERQRLFRILEDLVTWENSNNHTVLEAAKAEIARSTNGIPSMLLDPFAGGGAIPLEAQRLGLSAVAHDLNPVAVMINKAMIEIPPKFNNADPVNPNDRVHKVKNVSHGAQGLAADVQYYGEQVKKEAYRRIGELYPQIEVPKEQGGGKATVISWLWARTVQCPNPACRCEMPLVRSFVLSKKKGSEAWSEPVFQDGKLSFVVHQKEKAKLEGTVERNGAKCACCGTTVPLEYIRDQGKKKGLGNALMAIVAEGKKGRIYLTPTDEQIKAAQVEIPEDVPMTELPEKALGFRVQAYGMDKHYKLFTNRQLVALMTFCACILELQDSIEKDAINAGFKNDHIPLSSGGGGALAYAQAVRVYLAFALSRTTNILNAFCRWESSRQQSLTLFSRQAIPMVWDFAENNPFANAAGDYTVSLSSIIRVLENFEQDNCGVAEQYDAQADCGLRNIMVSTDPPYYDNIGYADLSDFFYVWLRQGLRDIYPDLFQTLLVPKVEELVATPFRFNGSSEKAKTFFEEGMLETCKQIYKYVTEDIPVSIYYAYKQSDSDEENEGQASTGWETMLSAIIKAGFAITGTWPMRTELANRAVASGTNALASSIVLVCRKRPENAQQTTRRNLINILRRELRPALKKLQESNIAPVDLAQSAIGPGMGVFSRYKKVLEADGTPMSVRSALQIINEEIDLYFNEQVGDFDAMSRFCVDLYTQNAFNDIKFGDADILARAKGTSVAALSAHDVVYAKAGMVHLIERAELPEKIDNNESCIWLLTQQLTQAMATGGVEACAKAVFMMFGSNAERAKDLAYRLYTIAEQKKWANEAFAYNALVVAWPDIQSRAAMMQRETPEQMDMFSMGLLNT